MAFNENVILPERGLLANCVSKLFLCVFAPLRELSSRKGAKAQRHANEVLICLWEGRLRRLGLPEDADDPPAFAVVHELNAVDTAREGLWVVRFVAALIRAPGVDDVAVSF